MLSSVYSTTLAPNPVSNVITDLARLSHLHEQRKLSEFRKKLLDLENAICRKENLVSHEKIPPSKPPEEPTPYTMFRDRVRVDIAHNIISPTYAYSPETYEFALAIRSMCPPATSLFAQFFRCRGSTMLMSDFRGISATEHN
jgi:hypothetical protein